MNDSGGSTASQPSPKNESNPKVTVAKLGLIQALLVAVIGGSFGLLATRAQLAITRPATESRIIGLFDQRLPVGMVVPSLLEPKLFSSLAGDSGDFDPRTSTWVPADGREVAGSAYAKNVSPITPDLRGMFLRGLNYTDGNRIRSDGKQDPDGDKRRSGEYEPDEVGPHSHAMKSYDGGDGGGRSGQGDLLYRPILNAGTELNNGKETRPKNVAVYYYLKIN